MAEHATPPSVSPAKPALPSGSLPFHLGLGIEGAFLAASLGLLGTCFLVTVRLVDWAFGLALRMTVEQAMVLLVFVLIALFFQALYGVALVLALVVGRASRGRPLSQRDRRRLFLSKVTGVAFLAVAGPLVIAMGCFGCAEMPRLETSFPVGVVYSSKYNISALGFEGFFPFDIHKYQKIHDELIRTGVMREEDFLVPADLREEELLLVHTPAYLKDVRSAAGMARCLEMPAVKLLGPLARPVILAAFEKATAGTILAARTALVKGIAFNLAGGYAHASRDEGGGFDIFADVPIAVRVLQKEGLVRRVLVVDCDVHQGNGTAREFADDPDVFTFDIYNRYNYPFPKVPAHFDLPVTMGTSGADYLPLLRENLPRAIEEARPDLVIYVAGTDVFAGDSLGGLMLTAEDILERDMFVIDAARSRGSSAPASRAPPGLLAPAAEDSSPPRVPTLFACPDTRRVPIAVVLSGGYSRESWRLHFDTIAETIRRYGHASSGPAP
jgi:histone deacetylase 11